MIVYHYTHTPRWRHIKTEGIKRPDNSFTFGLLAPTPDKWVHSKEFPNMWKSLKSHMGDLLLKVEVNPDTDRVFVMDRGHYEREAWADKYGFRETTEEALDAYYDSQVSLRDYLQDPEKYKFALPEVIFVDDIPSDRLSIAEIQPLLEEHLLEDKIQIGDGPRVQNTISERIKGAALALKSAPELKPWYDSYISKLNDLPREGITATMKS